MANFNLLVPKILFSEGGYSNDPDDTGNWYDGEIIGTNHGISAGCLATYLKRKPTVEEMKALTQSTAVEITKTLFWDKCKGDMITNQSIAEFIVDWYFNSGPAVAKKVQQAAGVKDDGIIGSQTIGAINAANQQELYNKIRQARINWVTNAAQDPKKAKYLKGWLARIDRMTFVA